MRPFINDDRGNQSLDCESLRDELKIGLHKGTFFTVFYSRLGRTIIMFCNKYPDYPETMFGST